MTEHADQRAAVLAVMEAADRREYLQRKFRRHLMRVVAVAAAGGAVGGWLVSGVIWP